LGNFWSLHNEVRDNHALVESGPFRWMRHPVYFSMILELLAGGVILGAPIACVCAFLVFLPALKMRIKGEEAALLEQLGDSYREYSKRTPAVFPFRMQ